MATSDETYDEKAEAQAANDESRDTNNDTPTKGKTESAYPKKPCAEQNQASSPFECPTKPPADNGEADAQNAQVLAMAAEAAAALRECEGPVAQWSVKEVCNFVSQLLGTDDYNEDFVTQEIDGSALVLLKEKHLVKEMGMKLGPALKIVSKVQGLIEANAEVVSPGGGSSRQ